MKRIVLLATGLMILFAFSALAEPLVSMKDGKATAGLVTAWKGSGKKVELTLKAGTDANAVADAVSQIDGVKKAKVKGGKVLAVGLPEADLLKAMDGVELGGDDLGDLAAAGLGMDDEGSGSSLRAKTKQRTSTWFKDRKTLARGTVVSVRGGTFPHAMVKVKIISAPSGDLGKKIRKGKTIIFRPTIKMKGKMPDVSDEKTQVNLGAWYLQKKDRVQIKVGKEVKGGFEAEVISR